MELTINSPACANKQGKNNKKQRYSNNRSAQRQRILQFFEIEKRPLSTFEFRERGICHPAGRIRELREAGHKILTYYIREQDANGVPHRIGQYCYFGCKGGKQDV